MELTSLRGVAPLFLLTACALTVSTTLTPTDADAATTDKTLTVRKRAVSKGSGTVTSDVSGIDCGATCKANFSNNSQVVLTATAGSDSVFTGWSPSSICSGTGACSVTMDKARTVTATFTGPYALSITKKAVSKGSGTVTSDVSGIDCGATCKANFRYDSTVVLTATAGSDSVFTGWSPTSICSGTGACQVTINKAKKVTATFTGPYALTVRKKLASAATGTVTSSPAGIDCGATCKTNFTYNSPVVLTAAPGTNSVFAGWSPSSICSGTGSCSVTMDKAKTVTARFTKADAGKGVEYSWHTFYGPSGATEKTTATAVVTDGSGNSYITGSANATWNGPNGEKPLHDVHGYTSLFLLKLDKKGNYLWHTFQGGANYNSQLYPADMAVDSSGNVYITGKSSATSRGVTTPWDTTLAAVFNTSITGTDSPWFAAKFTSSGELAWYTIYTAVGYSGAGHIALDTSGNVICTGYSTGTWDYTLPDPIYPFYQKPDHQNSYNGHVVKLDHAGVYKWHTFLRDLSQGALLNGAAVTTDSDNNIYLVGASNANWAGMAETNPPPLHDYNDGYQNLAVLKLSTNGSYLWHTFWGSADVSTWGTTATSVAARGNDKIYVTGYTYGTWNGADDKAPLHAFTSNGSGTSINNLVLKLNGGGAYQWHTFYGKYMTSSAIKLDNYGNLVLSGNDNAATWTGPNGEAPINSYDSDKSYVMSLDNSGSYLWHTFFTQGIGAVAVAGDGNLFSVGGAAKTWSGPNGEAPLHAFSGDPATVHTNAYIFKLGVIK